MQRSIKSRQAITRFLSVLIVVLAADLVSKSLSFEHVAGRPVDAADGPLAIPAHDEMTVVPYVLSLKLTVNRGAVFGMGEGRYWIFVGIAIVATIVLCVVFGVSPANAKMRHIAIGLVMAGALGNLYDRIMFEGVRDLLWLFPGIQLPFGWKWPGGSTDLYPWLFNIADVALIFGVIVLIFSGGDEQTSKKKKEKRKKDKR